MSKIRNVISTVVFLAIVFSLSALCFVLPDTEFSESERRELASFPEISAEALSGGLFSNDFEKYSADQFPFRESFRALKAGFNMNILNRLENNGLFVKDGHISKLDSPESEEMKAYAADKLTSVYEKFIKGNGGRVYLSIVPDKNIFFSEYPSLDYEGFIADMAEKLPFAEYIDILPLLSLDDYYATDTHWKQEKIVDVAKKLALAMGSKIKDEFTENTLEIPFSGVYLGQFALPFEPDTIKYLTSDAINSARITYYGTGSPKPGDMYNMEKASGKDAYEMFLSGVMPILTIENPNAENAKELVIFRDSFGSSLSPLLTSAYGKITVVDIRYIKSDFLGSFVSFENADVLFLYSTAILNNSTALQ